MLRCSKCILPSNYVGINFDEHSVCNFCRDWKEIKYKGGEALRAAILSAKKRKTNPSNKYDCLLGVSGGRDSSYLLYYLTNVLDLRVLAFSADNGLIPDQTIKNIERMVDKLGVDLLMTRHDYLKKCFRSHFSAWIHRPTVGMAGVLCTGCRIGIEKMKLDIAKEYNIPVVISGGTPLEGGGYKSNIIKVNPAGGRFSFVAGYLSELMLNPHWIINPDCMTIQGLEYYYNYLKGGKRDFIEISPFWQYLRWSEQEIIPTIERELGWSKNPKLESTWRGDCDVGVVKMYLYRSILGFDDKDDHLSSLIRDNQITRQDAMRRIEREGGLNEEFVEEIIKDNGFRLTDLNAAIEKSKARYNRKSRTQST